MRVILTADLHYGMRPAWDVAVEALARQVVEREPDVIVIVGDVAVADPRRLVECLGLFAASKATRLVVPGNHDVWTSAEGQGADSLAIYEQIFPKAAQISGFHTLDQAPVVLGGVAFVGSMGWYDYGFADLSLEVPRGAYESKRLPGVGMWNDGRFVWWKYDDLGFTERVLAQLAGHLATVREKAAHIVTVTHHLAFEQLVVRSAHRGWSFHNAFMGSPSMGKLFLAEPTVRLSVCGHSHHQRRERIGHIEVVNVGSTYTTKRFVTCEIDAAGIRSLDVEEVAAGKAS